MHACIYEKYVSIILIKIDAWCVCVCVCVCVWDMSTGQFPSTNSTVQAVRVYIQHRISYIHRQHCTSRKLKNPASADCYLSNPASPYIMTSEVSPTLAFAKDL